ncbi:HNH endonuclease [Psychrobacillus sp.]|uniref:HNH endonuclease n=1 Tax=Psychrobacillus sp. TaxID=1871623 RepID=UPI0028BDD41D|nr:HNH endonuclease [Psychrobacillus sp.]
MQSLSKLELEKKFHMDMLNIYKNGRKIGYNASAFLQMINTEKGIDVAKKLINSSKPSDGFTNLYLKAGIDGLALTVEALVLKEEYVSLFNEEERLTVIERLQNYGYEIPITQIENDKKSENNIYEFNFELFNKGLQNQEYVMGTKKKYYIITAKIELENASPKYLVYLLKNNIVVNKIEVESEISKKLLSTAKQQGILMLHKINPIVEIEDVKIVHYKQDRPNENPWQNDSNEVLEDLFKEYQASFNSMFLKTSLADIDSEQSEEDEYYNDGATTFYYGKRYERNPKNRAKAIEIHGLNCKGCGFNFEQLYGERGKDFIEIHHIQPLSTIQKGVVINPEMDLVPLCANCHRMIHRRKDNVLTIKELKEIIKGMN